MWIVGFFQLIVYGGAVSNSKIRKDNKKSSLFTLNVICKFQTKILKQAQNNHKFV